MRRWGIAVLLAAVLATRAHAAEVFARLSDTRVEPGGTVTLIITVTDPRGAVMDPQMMLPSSFELLGSSRSQESTYANGLPVQEVTFRCELGPSQPGRFTISSIRVVVGAVALRCDDQVLTVVGTSHPMNAGAPPDPGSIPSASSPAHASPVAPAGGSRPGVASLVLSLEPANPVVGQACRLRVQLIQRVDMSDDSQYDPPATPGFWAETWSDLTRFEGREGRRTVIVTESSLRLYPLAPGPAVITPARGGVTPSSSGLLDPLGGSGATLVQIRSDSLHVGVRPLPANAPAGFDGGVGAFELHWDADRSHTAQDQAINARLDVRGAGNLPLLRAPAFAPSEFEIFSTNVEDSLPAPGVLGRGRRTFLWTLLPKRAGRLTVEPPTFAWFDPATSRYVTATPAAFELNVLSARAGADSEDIGGMPGVFRDHPAKPGRRAAWPPLALFGGVLVALAAECWRRSQRPDPSGPERARQREWLRTVGLARGADFWRNADEVAGWLQDRGAAGGLAPVRETIAAARFGGRTDQEESIRRTLVERLGAAMPSPPARWPLQVAAVLLALLGVAGAVLALPQSVSSRLSERASAADQRARAGDVPAAEAEWARLWEESPGDPALAARLAWGALSRDDVAAATVWTLRGDRSEARDPALSAMALRVRDAGGLVGAPGRALPFRSFEWALIAFLLAAGAGLAWPRRALAGAFVVAACIAGAWWPVETAWRARQDLAVVRSSVPLPPTGVTLDSGQVVRVRGQSAGSLAVRAASDLEGTLPLSAVWRLGQP